MKPCPFCGRQPYVLHNTDVWVMHPQATWAVTCATCRIHGPESTVDEADAVRRWDNRNEAATSESDQVAKLLVQLIPELDSMLREAQRNRIHHDHSATLRLVTWRDLRTAVELYEAAELRRMTS